MVELKEGDWIYFRYGTSLNLMYVSMVTPGGAVLGKPNWLVSAGVFIDNHRLVAAVDENHLIHLGRGKLRCWWRFLPWRDVVIPFSGRPKLSPLEVYT